MRFKPTLILLLTLGAGLGPALARADGPTDFAQAQEFERVQTQSLRATGRALTGMGVLAYLASIPLAVLSFRPAIDENHDPAAEAQSTAFMSASIALTVSGAALVGTGVGLWSHANNVDRSIRKLSFGPGGLGVRF